DEANALAPGLTIPETVTMGASARGGGRYRLRRNRRPSHVLAIALLSLAVLCPGLCRAAPAPQSSIVIDAASGEVLSSSDPTALWRPASLTKLMTLYVTFEELAAGRLKLSDLVAVSAYAAAMPPTELGLAKGEKVTVETAILGTITRSANDAAVVLA